MELHLAGLDVECNRTGIEPPLEVEVVDTLLAQYQLLRLPVAAQQLFRQRGAVIGKVGLRADRDDPLVEAVTAQRLGGA